MNISNRLKLMKHFLQQKKVARQDTVIFFGTGFLAEIQNDTGFLEAPISWKAGTKLKIQYTGSSRGTVCSWSAVETNFSKNTVNPASTCPTCWFFFMIINKFLWVKIKKIIAGVTWTILIMIQTGQSYKFL